MTTEPTTPAYYRVEHRPDLPGGLTWCVCRYDGWPLCFCFTEAAAAQVCAALLAR